MILLYMNGGRYYAIMQDSEHIRQLIEQTKIEDQPCPDPDALLGAQVMVLEANGFDYEVVDLDETRLLFDDYDLKRDRLLWEVEKRYWPAECTLLLLGDWKETEQDMMVDNVTRVVHLD